MLTAAEIRRATYDRTYRRGRTYFQDGFVKKMQVQIPERGRDTVVTGEVRGSGRRSYETQITLSPEEEITDYSCTCPAADSYWGLCKHCVALALAYQADQKLHRYERSAVRTAGHRETAPVLSDLLHRYSVRGRMHRLGGPDGEIGLDCYFQTDRNGLLLEMKIGGRRKYVVKNLVKLVRDVEEMRQVRYGASLEFVHDRSAFTEEARELLTLLTEAVAGRYPDYREAYYEMSANYRYLLLRGAALEGFLNHFVGKTICLEERDMPVHDQDPPVTLKLTETQGGAEISVDPLTVYPGVSRTFVRKDKALWRLSEAFAERVLPAWQAIQQGQGGAYRRRTLFLSERDYGSFCAGLLPQLSELVQIDSGGLDLAAYAPAEPEFAVYLEMPEEETVTAAAVVRYEEQEYDLLEEAPEQMTAARDLEREAEVRALVKRYFPEAESPEARAGRRRKRIAEYLDGVPVRDLDADDGRDYDWEYDGRTGDGPVDEYGLPIRDLDEELAEEMREDGLPAGTRRRFALGEEAVYELVREGLTELSRAAEMYVDESIRRLSVRPAPKVSMGIGIVGELIDLSVQVEGLDAAEIAGILGAYRRRKKYFRLRNGDFVRMEENGLSSLSELAEGLSLSDRELAEGHAQLPRYRALYVESVLRDSAGARVKRETSYRQLISGMRDFSESDFEVPEALHAELRGYQRAGFRWLAALCENGFGGILADDMGLGKTLQMIALLLLRRAEAAGKPSLIIAPASLVYNWESEVQRFAPTLTVQVIAGTAPERQEQIARMETYDVNITSYDLLRRDIESYGEHAFDCCAADEAQYIKNAGTQAAKAVKRVQAAHRFALTGTPIENRLSDLWSIFDFLMPGYLFAYNRFREELESPIVKNGDEVVSRRLTRMVTPFILRRRKADVLKDLPDKLEETVTVRMAPEQEKLYRAATEQLRQELLHKNDDEVRRSRLRILSELTRLRQICCSPALCYEGYRGGSGKVDACLELLRSAVEGGHRVLVFSQFTSMLELLQEEWKQTELPFRYLSGSDSKLARRRMVDEFQRGDIPVFFISLKAGGTGLNLTAADIVIHVDPWWNVAAQNQATDRAHRIGQSRVVSVMKLVARDSIEEKILKLQEKKAALADSVVEGEGVRDTALNREELLELFR